MTSAIIQGLASGAIYALVAVGLILVFKGSRVLNLAQGEIGALSFMLVLVFGRKVGIVPTDTATMGVIAGVMILILTVIFSALFGIAVERLVMRRLVDRPAVQGTIATLGIAVVIINFEALAGGLLLPEEARSYPMQVPSTVGTGAFKIFDANVVSSLVVAVIATAALGIGLWVFFNRTKFGLGVVAATSDNTVARILGIPVSKVYLFTWGVGGALSGLAAALVPSALLADKIQPADMTFILVVSLAAAVVGGLDNIFGGIVGGLTIGVVIAVAKYQYPSLGGVENLAILLLVLGTLLIRPRGFLGGAGAEVA